MFFRVLSDDESLLNKCTCKLEPEQQHLQASFSKCPIEDGHVSPHSTSAFESCIDHRMSGNPEDNNLIPQLEEEAGDNLVPCMPFSKVSFYPNEVNSLHLLVNNINLIVRLHH